MVLYCTSFVFASEAKRLSRLSYLNTRVSEADEERYIACARKPSVCIIGSGLSRGWSTNLFR